MNLINRRNSQIKTMNSAFLSKIFSSPKFVSDYKYFLCNFNKFYNYNKNFIYI